MIFVNIFVAFVLEGFSRSNKENHNLVNNDDYAKLIQMWQDYDPKATGWIDPQDIAFLVYELPAPLGKAEEYHDVLKKIVDGNEDNKQEHLLKPSQRFVIKLEKNMVLPTSLTISTLRIL